MPRVLPVDVLAIITTQRDVTPFISAAHAMVEQYLATAGLAEPLLAEIERWWSAHLVCVADPRVSEKKLSNTTIVLEKAKLGEGLKSTLYGQTVLSLDPTGTLATAPTLQRASLEVVTPSCTPT